MCFVIPLSVLICSPPNGLHLSDRNFVPFFTFWLCFTNIDRSSAQVMSEKLELDKRLCDTDFTVGWLLDSLTKNDEAFNEGYRNRKVSKVSFGGDIE